MDSATDPYAAIFPVDGTPFYGSLLAHGDNSEILRSLTSRMGVGDRPRLVYLDPPFNTGEQWIHYEDSAATEEWEAQLRLRLELVRELLAPDGSVWLHLDDRQQHRGRALMDEVFGVKAFVATVIWQKRTSRENRKAFSSAHDYLHVYAPIGPKRWKLLRNGLPDTGTYANPDGDPRGPWRSIPICVQAGHATASQFYEIVGPAGTAHWPPRGRCWAYSESRLKELDDDGRIYWPKNGAGKPRLKRFEYESQGLTPSTLWLAAEVGDNASAKKSLMANHLAGDVFDTPKPEQLLERVVSIATNPGDVVLDPYLGSGTTAVAAERLGRRWVGIERSIQTINQFVLPRLAEIAPKSWTATGTVAGSRSAALVYSDGHAARSA